MFYGLKNTINKTITSKVGIVFLNFIMAIWKVHKINMHKHKNVATKGYKLNTVQYTAFNIKFSWRECSGVLIQKK
jgi:hypothetical protein